MPEDIQSPDQLTGEFYLFKENDCFFLLNYGWVYKSIYLSIILHGSDWKRMAAAAGAQGKEMKHIRNRTDIIGIKHWDFPSLLNQGWPRDYDHPVDPGVACQRSRFS